MSPIFDFPPEFKCAPFEFIQTGKNSLSALNAVSGCGWLRDRKAPLAHLATLHTEPA